jgi:hypothetical protein
MNKKLSGIFWGIVLIAGGLFTLAQTLGYRTPQNPTLWAIIFGGLSLAAFVFYFLEGLSKWGWLFPAGIFGALAILLGLAEAGVESPAMAAPIFIGVGLPFVVAYFQDRAKNWWALIPTGVMAFLTLVLFSVDRVRNEWIGAGLFFILAAIFTLIYLGKRATWAAIVALVMFVLGFMSLLAMTPRPELAGILVLAAIGLPFLLVYLRSAEGWWAIIPAGILLTMAIVTAIVLLSGAPSGELDPRYANAIIFVGMAATFAIVWQRHHKPWGMVLTLLSVMMGVAALFFGNLDNFWALFVIAAGVYLVYNALRRQTN